MKTESLSTPFVFREPYNSAFLKELYEDDIAYIEQIFRLTLTEFKSDLALLQQFQKNKDLKSCRSQLHKIRPSMGYVGLKRSEEHCSLLEEKIKTAKSWNEIQTEVGWCIIELQECSKLLEATTKVLIHHNEKSKNL